jgi:hypothetical protein
MLSCQKEITPAEGIVPGPGPTSDSVYLLKMYGSYFDGSIEDTVEVATFNYDNLKRLTQINIFSDSTLQGNPFETYTYYYNGNDTIPYKSKNISYDDFLGQTDSLLSYFYFNSTGQRVKDSLLEHILDNTGTVMFISQTIKNYQYVSDKIYGYENRTIILGMSQGSQTLEYDTATLDAGGNVIANRSTDGTSVPYMSTSAVTYDSHLNPFSRLSNFKAFELLYPSGETLFLDFQQKNNISHITEYVNGNLHIQSDYSYIYNLNGYPKEIIVEDPAVPGQYEKITYIYQSL